jgi:hypothetical protein
VSAGEEVLASGNDDEFYDFGLTYTRDHGDFKVAGRLGYSIRGSDAARPPIARPRTVTLWEGA